jgi:raffinose/stachyose/melibiose transport system substrate-binding protein
MRSKLIRAWALATAGFTAAGAFAAELTFWSWRTEDKAFYEAIAKQWKAISGDDVKFTSYKNTEYPAVLSAALASGGGPDIIHTRAYGGLATLADAGYLVPLSKTEVPNLAAFGDGVLAAAVGRKPPHDKQVYGVPFATQSLGIFVNRALLAKNGINTLPATWAEFKAACVALKAKKVPCIANGSKEAPVLEQVFGVVGPNLYGGSDYFRGVMGGSRSFTDPAFVKAIEEVVALKEFMPPNQLGIGENESRSLFASGAAAFYLTGTWNIDTVRDLNPKLEFEFMPAPPLAAGGASFVPTFVDGTYAVNAKSANRAAALKFINFLASKEYGSKFTAELRQISAVPGVKPTDPILLSVAEMTAKSGTPFLMLVGFRYENPNGSVLLRDGLQKLMQGQGTATTLAADIQAGLATWHKPFQKK